MGQRLGGFWGRLQGKRSVQKICDKIFDQQGQKQNGAKVLRFDDLHLAIMLVYNDVNKQFHGPHREPPSVEQVRAKVEVIRTEEKLEAIDRERFHQLILSWISRDLRQLLLNKFLLALLAAPAMSELTKVGASRVPRLRDVVEKIPTPVFITAYTLGFVILQDRSIVVD